MGSFQRGVLLASAVALGLFLLLFWSGTGLNYRELGELRDRTEVQARQFFRQNGLSLEGVRPNLQIELNESLLLHLRSVLPAAQAQAIYTETFTSVRLSLGWRGKPQFELMGSKPQAQPYSYTVDGRGRILGFQLPAADIGSQPIPLETTVQEVAAAFVLQTLGFDPQKLDPQPEIAHSVKEDENLHSLRWEGADPQVPQANLVLTLDLKGATPIRFLREVILTPEARDTLDLHTQLSKFLPALVTYVLVGFSFLVFIGRIRREEIDFRLGLLGGVAMFGAVAVGQGPLFAIHPQFGGLVWIFVTIVNSIFLGILMVPLFSTAESLTREHWPEKLTSLDYLLSGHLFSRALGQALLMGSGLALLWLAFQEAVKYWLIPLVHGQVLPEEAMMMVLPTSYPGLALLGLYLVAILLIEGCARFFLTAWLRPRIKRPALLVLVVTLLTFWPAIQEFPRIAPLPVAFLMAFGISLFFTVIYVRFDWMTVLWTHIVVSLFPTGLALAALGDVYLWPGLGLIGLMVSVTALGGLMNLRTAVPKQKAYVPGYISKLRQRERMQHELELAHRAQQNILPRSVPLVPGLDIATVCVPAMEVGGDYYDFIQLGPRRLVVVIGDVSGKGIRAAFYMTLAKGMLLSLAHSGRSPREVLSRLNDLFYSQIERGVFLSMVYGEFDLEQGTLTLARAGHNPLIALRAGSGRYQELAPQGLALGLVRGRTFDDGIEEMSVHFSPGDVFVFYTDGFTEAMNGHREEFGEERMCQILTQYSSGNAADLLGRVNQAIEDFVAGTPQHDDMTMVLVRMTEEARTPVGEAR